MNVSLTPELEQMISIKVKSGMYNTASEVVREGLRLMQQRDEMREKKLAALRADLRTGLEAVEAGRTVNGEEFLLGWKKRLEDRIEKNG